VGAGTGLQSWPGCYWVGLRGRQLLTARNAPVQEREASE